MLTRRRPSAALVVVFGVLAVVLAGCADAAPPSANPTVPAAGPGMMNGYGGAAPGPGMMNGNSPGTSPASGCAVPPLPGHVVTAHLADMDMMAPQADPAPPGARMMLRATPPSVPAGQISLIALNMGGRPHELVVLPLAVGARSGQRRVGSDGTADEAGAIGEASAACTGGEGDGVPVGSSSWTTLTLPPGRYELICNLPAHYADGMHDELDVTPT
jgi:uncharacterized cupredoxin-like copper-binding protein